MGGEIRVAQAFNTEVTSHISEAAKPAKVINGFYNQRFVHFAFYGTLEAGKPFDGGFELYGDERLSLLDIVCSCSPPRERTRDTVS